MGEMSEAQENTKIRGSSYGKDCGESTSPRNFQFSPAKKALSEYLESRERSERILSSTMVNPHVVKTGISAGTGVRGYNLLEVFRFNASEALKGHIKELRELAMSNNDVPNTTTTSGIPLDLTGPTIYDYMAGNIPPEGLGLQPAPPPEDGDNSLAPSEIQAADIGGSPNLVTTPPVNTSTSSNVPTSNVVPEDTLPSENPNLVVEPPQSNPTQPENPSPDETIQYSIPE